MVTEDGLISPAYVACKPSKENDSRFAHHMFHPPRMICLFWAYSYGLTDDRRRLYYLEFAQLKQNREALNKQESGLMQ